MFYLLIKSINLQLSMGQYLLIQCRFRSSAWNATGVCNANCACAPDFGPVCGSDKVTYLSACYAGCRSTLEADGQVGLKVERQFLCD